MLYRYLRNTHLFLGLFTFLFVMMYAVSALQLAHPEWFNTKPSVTEQSETIDPLLDARKASRLLIDKYGWRGELRQVTVRREDILFRVIRPGTVYEVIYSPATGKSTIKTSIANWLGMLNRIHHIGALDHEYWLINAWSVFVGLVSLALILIALSGIYMWFKLHKERLIGGILLAAGLSYGLGLMLLLYFA